MGSWIPRASSSSVTGVRSVPKHLGAGWSSAAWVVQVRVGWSACRRAGTAGVHGLGPGDQHHLQLAPGDGPGRLVQQRLGHVAADGRLHQLGTSASPRRCGHQEGRVGGLPAQRGDHPQGLEARVSSRRPAPASAAGGGAGRSPPPPPAGPSTISSSGSGRSVTGPGRGVGSADHLARRRPGPGCAGSRAMAARSVPNGGGVASAGPAPGRPAGGR